MLANHRRDIEQGCYVCKTDGAKQPLAYAVRNAQLLDGACKTGVLAAASMDGFTAARTMVERSEPPGTT